MKINKKYYECVFIKAKAYRKGKSIDVCYYSPDFGTFSSKIMGLHSMDLTEILDEIGLNFAKNRKCA